MQEISNVEHTGALIVFRAGEVGSKQFFWNGFRNDEIWQCGVWPGRGWGFTT